MISWAFELMGRERKRREAKAGTDPAALMQAGAAYEGPTMLHSLSRGRPHELLSVCSKSVAEPSLALRLLWTGTVKPF